MDTLIDYGFIKQIVSGVPTMSVSAFHIDGRIMEQKDFLFQMKIEDIKGSLKKTNKIL